MNKSLHSVYTDFLALWVLSVSFRTFQTVVLKVANACQWLSVVLHLLSALEFLVCHLHFAPVFKQL